MQDLNQLTSNMSLSEITERPSPTITVPDDVAHSILLQLDPQDLSTVPTLLTCRLVSRSFDTAAQSASVWRPLVQQRWTTGKPEFTKLPNASDQSLMDFAIDPLDPPVHPRAVFRARTLVDRIALAAAARRGDSVEEKDRIESHDTIAMLGPQVYDAIIRLKTVSLEERHDYLSCHLSALLDFGNFEQQLRDGNPPDILIPELSVNLGMEDPVSYHFPLEDFLAGVFDVYPNDAYLVHKHFHSVLFSAPKHLRDFNNTFEELLPSRWIETPLFECDLLAVTNNGNRALHAKPEELHRLSPSDQLRWQAARKLMEESGTLGEWFSSRANLEYPTYLKTKAWSAVYPED
ncbi:hypothetical protein RQP46_003323 [Phenoliferia psychrophenolica]